MPLSSEHVFEFEIKTTPAQKPSLPAGGPLDTRKRSAASASFGIE